MGPSKNQTKDKKLSLILFLIAFDLLHRDMSPITKLLK